MAGRSRRRPLRARLGGLDSRRALARRRAARGWCATTRARPRARRALREAGGADRSTTSPATPPTRASPVAATALLRAHCPKASGLRCAGTRVERRTLEIDYQPRRGLLAPADGSPTTRSSGARCRSATRSSSTPACTTTTRARAADGLVDFTRRSSTASRSCTRASATTTAGAASPSTPRARRRAATPSASTSRARQPGVAQLRLPRRGAPMSDGRATSRDATACIGRSSSLVALASRSSPARRRGQHARRRLLLRRRRAVLVSWYGDLGDNLLHGAAAARASPRRRRSRLRLQPRAPGAHEVAVRLVVARPAQVPLPRAARPPSRSATRTSTARSASSTRRPRCACPPTSSCALMAMLVFLFGAAAWSRAAGLVAATLTSPRRASSSTRSSPLRRAHRRDVGRRRLRLLARARRPRWGWRTGVIFGLALATKHNAFFLPSVLLPHFALRRLAAPRASRRCAPFIYMATLGVVGLSRLLAVAVVRHHARASANTSRSTCTTSITTWSISGGTITSRPSRSRSPT